MKENNKTKQKNETNKTYFYGIFLPSPFLLILKNQITYMEEGASEGRTRKDENYRKTFKLIQIQIQTFRFFLLSPPTHSLGGSIYHLETICPFDTLPSSEQKK